jgi:16S rRNA (adenine1518-N6/adenine1519-N6)-dimethyltransferase
MLPKISDHLRKYSLFADKKFSQNFIFDENVLNKITSVLPIEGETIVEIGPGPCGLTRSILNKKPKRLILIEKDEKFKPIISDIKNHYKEIDIQDYYLDVLKFDFNKINEPFSVYSNLPYSIASQVLIQMIYYRHNINRMCLMFQKEMADRIISEKDSKEYGKLSIIAQIFFHVREEFVLKSHLFIPPPKVDSSVVSFKPKDTDVNFKELEKLLQNLFSMRRKTINSILNKTNKDLLQIFSDLNIDKNLRPENLSIDDYINITKLI